MPDILLGAAASQMEKRGIRTERGNINREIEVTNQKLRQLKARLTKLQNWLKEEQDNTEPAHACRHYYKHSITEGADRGAEQIRHYTQSESGGEYSQFPDL